MLIYIFTKVVYFYLVNSCGPIFGAGADLLISSNCNSNSESYSNLHSYGDQMAPASLATEYNFTVRDYEVFTYKHN